MQNALDNDFSNKNALDNDFSNKNAAILLPKM